MKFIPPNHIELSPWKTPLGTGTEEKEMDRPAYHDEYEEGFKLTKHKKGGKK